MAVTDAYATALQYRAGIDQDDTAEDTELLEYLKATSRFIDRKLGRFFTVDAVAVARTYDGNGEARLAIDDVSSTTGLIVDVDLNGDFDYTDTNEAALILNTDFWIGPDNAALGAEPEPYWFIEVHPNTTKLSVWPKQRRSVRVTAAFGWPAVPVAIEKATIAITKQLRDVSKQPYTLTLQMLEERNLIIPKVEALVEDLMRQYARKDQIIVG